MSNLDPAPVETRCGADPTGTRPQILEPRQVPLGGPRAMSVRRTLPQRARSMIGGWCLVDHYGSDGPGDDVMAIPGHPHTGLQTVSWLFSGEIEHRDTTGAHAVIRPGEVNLMTAGHGIAHSEFSAPDVQPLHGLQLWVALPDAHRDIAPHFENHAPHPVEQDGARILVFVGSLAGTRSPVKAYSPLLGAEITLPAGATVRLDVDPTFEHGVLVDTGTVTVDAEPTAPDQLLYRPPGSASLLITASDDGPARVMLLGGEPLGEQIVMWWNFIGRTHEEIVEHRERWEAERHGGTVERFGVFPDEWESTLPAPGLPNARLRPRG